MRFPNFISLLIIIDGASAKCNSEGNSKMVVPKVTFGEKFDLNCGCLSAADYKPEYTTKWWRQAEELKTVSENYKRTRSNLTIMSARKENEARYKCKVLIEEDEEKLIDETEFVVNFFPHVYINDGKNNKISVIEGYKIDLKCVFVGIPEGANIEWHIESKNNRTNYSPFNDVKNGRVIVTSSETTDKGNYNCSVTDKAGNTFDAQVTVVIKGKYRAVWPFLGLCLEVFIVLISIYYYEQNNEESERTMAEFTIQSTSSRKSDYSLDIDLATIDQCDY